MYKISRVPPTKLSYQLCHILEAYSISTQPPTPPTPSQLHPLPPRKKTSKLLCHILKHILSSLCSVSTLNHRILDSLLHLILFIFLDDTCTLLVIEDYLSVILNAQPKKNKKRKSQNIYMFYYVCEKNIKSCWDQLKIFLQYRKQPFHRDPFKTSNLYCDNDTVTSCKKLSHTKYITT